MHRYLYNQNIGVIEQGAWKKKWLFCSIIGFQDPPLWACCFVPVFQCHALKRHMPIEKECNILPAPDFTVQW